MNKLLARATRIIGVAICVGFFVAQLHLSGSLEYFIHIPSMIGMGSLMVGGMLVAYRFEELMLPAAILLGGSADQSGEKFKRALFVVGRAYNLAWASAFILCVIGLIQMLGNLSDPSQIGGAIVVASIPLFYGALLAEFIIAPLRSNIQCKAVKVCPTAVMDNSRLNRSVVGFIITACLFLVAFAIVSWIPFRRW